MERHRYGVMAESDWQKVFSGISQGSILGSITILFIIFINDRPGHKL